MSWNIDTTHSSVGFSAKHMMIATVRGQFEKFDVQLNLNEDTPELSSVVATIDTASINTHEERRDGHLRSADFFDVAHYPTLTFRSTRVERAGANKYRLIGDLTIKDVTREVVLNVTEEGKGKDPWGGTRWGFSAETTINRKDWGLNWNVALETGGFLVSDLIKIALEVEAVLAPVAAAAATA